MKTIEIFDPALCCSSGVCGADVDQALVDFAAAAASVSKLGVDVTRHNLVSDPTVFVQNEQVRQLMENPDALPAIVVDGQVVMSGRYPTLEELVNLAADTLQALPLADQSSDSADAEGGCCCGGGGCC